MTTSRDIENEIASLESEYTALENQLAQDGSPDDESLLRLPAIKAKIGVLLKRAGLVRKDEAQAANEADLERYEQLTQVAHAHYTRQKEIDIELKALAERQAELIAEKSHNRSEYHAPKHERIELRVALQRIPENRSQLKALDEQYKVEGYM